MRSDLRRALRGLLLPSLAVGLVAAIMPGRLTLAVRIYALVVCGVVLWLAVGALRRAYPRARSLRPSRARRSTGRRPPPGLGRIEHEAALGVAGAFDLHFRLVPRLRSIAAGLLSSRRRISLDAEPEAARSVLGAETWELVRHDRPAPDDRLVRGISPADFRHVVESLERI